MEKFELTEEDKRLIEQIEKNDTVHNKVVREKFFDAYSKFFEDMRKEEDCPIMLMYLMMATAKGITLKEACEEYYVDRNCNPAYDSEGLFAIDYDIKLKPRGEKAEISSSEFEKYQMKVALFLQDMVRYINEHKKL